jgi:sugar phosphate isomerase/epimerase
MNNNVELLASYWTISAGLPHTDREYSLFDFKDRVEAAARAGFKGFGLWHADLDHILQRRSLQEMKRIFDDNGIKHIELEFLTDWFLDGERKKQSDIRKKKLFAAAEALQAKQVKVGDFYYEKCPMPRLIEAFAALCAEAAEHGTRIAFEPMAAAMPLQRGQVTWLPSLSAGRRRWRDERRDRGRPLAHGELGNLKRPGEPGPAAILVRRRGQ